MLPPNLSESLWKKPSPARWHFSAAHRTSVRHFHLTITIIIFIIIIIIGVWAATINAIPQRIVKAYRIIPNQTRISSVELESLPRQWLGHPFSPSLTKVRWIKGIEGLRRLHSFLSPFLCDQLGLLDFYPSCPAHQKLVCQNGLTAFNAFNVLQEIHSAMSIFSNSCLRISHKVGTLPENVTGLHQEELCMIWIQLPKCCAYAFRTLSPLQCS